MQALKACTVRITPTCAPSLIQHAHEGDECYPIHSWRCGIVHKYDISWSSHLISTSLSQADRRRCPLEKLHAPPNATRAEMPGLLGHLIIALLYGVCVQMCSTPGPTFVRPSSGRARSRCSAEKHPIISSSLTPQPCSRLRTMGASWTNSAQCSRHVSNRECHQHLHSFNRHSDGACALCVSMSGTSACS